MYVRPNYRTKSELRKAVAAGDRVEVFAPGIGTPNRNGTEYVEGPHYPQPHSWYAQVTVKDGLVVAVK